MTLDKLGTELVDEYLGRLNRQFYYDGPKKAFFWDRSLLIQAIQAPAVYLYDRGIRREFPVEKYRQILNTVIIGIQHHGDTARIRHFGRYFLTSVQSHMRSHHGDDYYQEAIATRNVCAGIDAGKLFQKKIPEEDSSHRLHRRNPRHRRQTRRPETGEKEAQSRPRSRARSLRRHAPCNSPAAIPQTPCITPVFTIKPLSITPFGPSFDQTSAP
ncbi:MAG: hypothetical protein ABSE62_00385 [Chthoniobacteraceae bacterium]|jgi:hypothetical protein